MAADHKHILKIVGQYNMTEPKGRNGPKGQNEYVKWGEYKPKRYKNVCVHCHRVGHIAKNCTFRVKGMKKIKGRAIKGCSNCGQQGHWANICTQPWHQSYLTRLTGEEDCYICGQLGHTDMECPKFQGQSDHEFKCANCNEEGHLAKECP